MPSFLPLWDSKTEGTPYNPGTNSPTANAPTEGLCTTQENGSPENQPPPGHDFGSDGSQPLIDIEGEAPPQATGTDDISGPLPSITDDGAATEPRDAGQWPLTNSLIDALPEVQSESPAEEHTSDLGRTRSQVPTSVLSVSSEPSRPSLIHIAPRIPYAGPGRPEGPGLFGSSVREDSFYSQQFLTNNVQAAQQTQIRHRRGAAVHKVDAGNLFIRPHPQLERTDSSALLSSESSTLSDSSSENGPTTQTLVTEGGDASSLQGPQNESTEVLASGASSIYTATPLLELDGTHVREHEAGNTSSSQAEQLFSTESQTTGAISAEDQSALLDAMFKAKSTWPAFESTPAYSNDLGSLSIPAGLSQCERVPGAYPSTNNQNSEEERGSFEEETATKAPESAAKQQDMEASPLTPSYNLATSNPSDSSPNAWYSETEEGSNPYSFTVTWYAPESELDSGSQYFDTHSTLTRSWPQSDPGTHAPLLGTAALSQTSPPRAGSPDCEETAEGASESLSSKLDKGKSTVAARDDDELSIDESDPVESHRDKVTLTNKAYVEDDAPSVMSENLQRRSD
ncbi:hypothetical protein M752DRAFT_266123 [Aspergillus phoenicis ATCC 13157]|uniref:Uncharacterized protein n=1 Tax=Aspergillus phoenicis ATCC 13157 TaxID=1353007 RepID=A0A370PKA3_ASPPH|nr:hypothetical protein M752DRAFT_266123 [Aspergillus phoenicis ATCC 13157]GLA28350.1 hypothetical protein AnigIFM63326_005924 [Aspergillus niger]